MDLQNLTDAEAITVPEAVARRDELIGERVRVLGFLLERRGDRAAIDPGAFWDTGDASSAERTAYLVSAPDEACEPAATILLHHPGFSDALDQANIPSAEGAVPFLRAGFVLAEGTLLPSEFPQFTLAIGQLTIAVLLMPGVSEDAGGAEQNPIAHALVFGAAAADAAERTEEAGLSAALQAAVNEVRYCRENRLPVNLVKIAAEFCVDFHDLVQAVKTLPPMHLSPPE